MSGGVGFSPSSSGAFSHVSALRSPSATRPTSREPEEFSVQSVGGTQRPLSSEASALAQRASASQGGSPAITGSPADLRDVRGEVESRSGVLDLGTVQKLLEGLSREITDEASGKTSQGMISKLLGLSVGSVQMAETGSALITASHLSPRPSSPQDQDGSIEMVDPLRSVPPSDSEDIFAGGQAEQRAFDPHVPSISGDEVIPFQTRITEVRFSGDVVFSDVTESDTQIPSQSDFSINPFIPPFQTGESVARGPSVVQDSPESVEPQVHPTVSPSPEDVGQPTQSLHAQGQSLGVQGSLQMLQEGAGRVSSYLTGGTKTPLVFQADTPFVGKLLHEVVNTESLPVIAGMSVGLSVVANVLAMQQNLSSRSDALSRQEMAQLMLDNPTPGIRDVSLSKLISEAREIGLKNPEDPKLKKMNAHIQFIFQLGSRPLSGASQAIARQIVESASPTFKLAKVTNSTLSLGSTGVSIAVMAGAVTTPVGWVAAGVAGATSLSLTLYNKRVASQRLEKIGECKKAFDELYMLHNNLSAGLHSIDSSVRSEARVNLGQLTSNLGGKTLELLQLSPEAGARALLKGLEMGDPGCQFIAHQVLGISVENYQALKAQGQNETLVNLFKIGMPLKPDA
jgi:hypothetical protein